MYIIISLFCTLKAYSKNIKSLLLKISINNHALLYIHINTHNNYHKTYTYKHPKYFAMIPIKL